VRAPNQCYGEDLNGVYGGGDLRYSEDCRRGTPSLLEIMKRGSHCLVGKRDLRRLREIPPSRKISLLGGLDGSPITKIGCCSLMIYTP
jgi:hypothetical protein